MLKDLVGIPRNKQLIDRSSLWDEQTIKWGLLCGNENLCARYGQGCPDKKYAARLKILQRGGRSAKWGYVNLKGCFCAQPCPSDFAGVQNFEPLKLLNTGLKGVIGIDGVI